MEKKKAFKNAQEVELKSNNFQSGWGGENFNSQMF